MMLGRLEKVMVLLVGLAATLSLVDEQKTLAGDLNVVVNSYDVQKILERLSSEAGIHGTKSEEWLRGRIEKFLPTVKPGKNDTKQQTVDNVSEVQSLGRERITMRLDQNGCGMVFERNTLFVACPRSNHQEIARSLETLSLFGFRQVLIRTNVIRGAKAEMSQLPINWQHVESLSQIAGSPTSDEVQLAAYEPTAGRIDSTAVKHGSYVAAREVPSAGDPRLPPNSDRGTFVEATSIIERSTPVLYTLLTPEESERVLLGVQQLSSAERVLSPQVVVFNGQLATVSNTVERPFVTGVRPMLVGPPGKRQIQFAPKIRVYPEGTTMLMRPELVDGKRVSLSFFLEISQVRDVDTLDIPRFDGGQDMTIQMPEVASTRFRTRLDLPLDHTLAVSTFETDENGEKHTILVLCKCSVRDVEQRSAR